MHKERRGNMQTYNVQDDVLYSVFQQLQRSELGVNLKLIGAFALKINLQNYPLAARIRPSTQDIDFVFDLTNVQGTTINKITDSIAYIVEQTPNFRIEVKKKKVRDKSLTIVFNAYSLQTGEHLVRSLKIDAGMKEQIIHKTMIQTVEEALVTKIMLETEDESTRRLKDVIDIYKILTTYYEGGITKGLYNYLKQEYQTPMIQPQVWFNQVVIQAHIDAVSTGKMRTTLKSLQDLEVEPSNVIHYVAAFIRGISDPNTPDTSVFYKGQWHFV